MLEGSSNEVNERCVSLLCLLSFILLSPCVPFCCCWLSPSVAFVAAPVARHHVLAAVPSSSVSAVSPASRWGCCTDLSLLVVSFCVSVCCSLCINPKSFSLRDWGVSPALHRGPTVPEAMKPLIRQRAALSPAVYVAPKQTRQQQTSGEETQETEGDR